MKTLKLTGYRPLLIVAIIAVLATIFLVTTKRQHVEQVSEETFIPQTTVNSKNQAFILEMKKHTEMQSLVSDPVDIIRIALDGSGCYAKGVLVSYADGWTFIFTVGHVFEKQYGGVASYKVIKDKQQIGWVMGVTAPQDFDSKLAPDFSPDVVICEIGKNKTLINPICVTTGTKIREDAILVNKIILKPLEKGMKDMPVEAVMNWHSKFPVFIARQSAVSGESGSGYIGQGGRLFLLSGSDREFVFLVTANPMDLKYKLGE